MRSNWNMHWTPSSSSDHGSVAKAKTPAPFAEFKPLARASTRNDDRGRVAATYGVNKVATAISFDPAMLAASLEGDTYEYADVQEIETLGMLRESTLKRLRRDQRTAKSEVVVEIRGEG